MAERDRHIRRSGSDYAHALRALLPQGLAWPTDPDSVLQRVVDGLAETFDLVDRRAADLLEQETDPRLTIEMLLDWERAWGLPDECLAEPLTFADRRKALMLRMTRFGAQSREFFIAMALEIGYTIRISENAPFMVGISQVGNTRDEFEIPRWQIGPGQIRFVWKIHVGRARLSWFRMSSGELGVDPHLRIGRATDLECIMHRLKPAHTYIVFDYSGMTHGGEFAGTP